MKGTGDLWRRSAAVPMRTTTHIWFLVGLVPVEAETLRGGTVAVLRSDSLSE